MKSFKNKIAGEYDKIASEYDQSYELPIHRIEDEYIFDKIQLSGLLDKGNNIVDLGCGTGNLLDNFRIDPWNYTGIDISKEMLKRAAVKHPKHTFKQFAIEDTQLEPNSFDSALSLFGSFSHIDYHSWGKALSELHRILKPGGRFLVMLCSRRYPKRKSYILNLHNIEENYLQTYFAFNTIHDFSQLFQDVELSGMTLTECYQKIVPYRLAKWLYKKEIDLLGKRYPDMFFIHVITGMKPFEDTASEITNLLEGNKPCRWSTMNH